VGSNPTPSATESPVSSFSNEIDQIGAFMRVLHWGSGPEKSRAIAEKPNQLRRIMMGLIDRDIGSSVRRRHAVHCKRVFSSERGCAKRRRYLINKGWRRKGPGGPTGLQNAFARFSCVM
jgi:hypothetical protein